MKIGRTILLTLALIGAGCGSNLRFKLTNSWKDSGYVITHRGATMNGNGEQFWTIAYDSKRVKSLSLCGKNPQSTNTSGDFVEAWFRYFPSSCGSSLNLNVTKTDGSSEIISLATQ